MKPASQALIVLAALCSPTGLQADDAQPPIRYRLSLSAQGFDATAPTGAAETLCTTGARTPQAMDLWKDCPHPQLAPCARSASEHGRWMPAAVVPSWQALGPALMNVAAAGVEAQTRMLDHRIEGTLSLMLDRCELPTAESVFASGKRLLVAIPSRRLTRPAHTVSASWSSTLEPVDIALPAGYEIVTETFATVELTRCSPGDKRCDTEIVFQRAYPADGVGGFELPASLFEVNGSTGQISSLVLYLEQRISIGPSPDSTD